MHAEEGIFVSNWVFLCRTGHFFLYRTMHFAVEPFFVSNECYDIEHIPTQWILGQNNW